MTKTRDEKSVEFYLKVGKNHAQHSAFGLAIIAFDHAEENFANEVKGIDNQTVAEVYYQRGLARLAQGFYDSATKDFNAAQQLFVLKKDKGYSLYKMGISQLLSKDFQDAILSFKQALPYLSDIIKIDCYQKLGQAQYISGDFSHAIDSFNKSLSGSNKQVECRELLAKSYLAYSETFLKSDPQESIDLLNQALPYLSTTQQRQHYSNLLAIACTKIRKQEIKEKQNIQAMIDALSDPVLTHEKKEEYAKLLLKTTLDEAKGGHLTIEMLNKTISAVSNKYASGNQQDIANCYYQLSKIYWKLYVQEQDNSNSELEYKLLGIKNAEFAIKTLPKHDESTIKGSSYLYLSLFHKGSDLALKYVKKAFPVFTGDIPWRAKQYHDCGMTLNAKNKPAEAIVYFEKSIETFSAQNEYAYAALSYTHLALSYQALKQYSKVITCSQKAINLWDEEENAGNPAKKFQQRRRGLIHQVLANAHLVLGEYEACIVENENALLMFNMKNSDKKLKAKCYLDAGIAHLLLGNNEKALENILSCMDNDPYSIKNLDNKFLTSIINLMPDCYDLVKIYLSNEQRKYAELHKEDKEIQKESSVNQSVSTVDFSHQNKNAYNLLEHSHKKSWLSMWRKNKVAASQSSISMAEGPSLSKR